MAWDKNRYYSRSVTQTRNEILQLLERARAGDESVTEQVREMMTICSEFAESLGGDLGQITERLLYDKRC